MSAISTTTSTTTPDQCRDIGAVNLVQAINEGPVEQKSISNSVDAGIADLIKDQDGGCEGPGAAEEDEEDEEETVEEEDEWEWEEGPGQLPGRGKGDRPTVGSGTKGTKGTKGAK